MKKPITEREIIVQLIKRISPAYLAKQYRQYGWSEQEIIELEKEAKKNNKWFEIMAEEARKK